MSLAMRNALSYERAHQEPPRMALLKDLAEIEERRPRPRRTAAAAHDRGQAPAHADSGAHDRRRGDAPSFPSPCTAIPDATSDGISGRWTWTGQGLSPSVFRSGKASYICDVDTDEGLTEQARALDREIGVRSGIRTAGRWGQPHRHDLVRVARATCVRCRRDRVLRIRRVWHRDRPSNARLFEAEQVGAAAGGADRVAQLLLNSASALTRVDRARPDAGPARGRAAAVRRTLAGVDLAVR